VQTQWHRFANPLAGFGHIHIVAQYGLRSTFREGAAETTHDPNHGIVQALAHAISSGSKRAICPARRRQADMAHDDRVRALVNAPQAYAPSHMQEAAAYLLASSSVMEEEPHLATDAIEWLGGKRDELKQAGRPT